MSASLDKIAGLCRSILLAAVTIVLLGMSEVGASAEQPAAAPAATPAPPAAAPAAPAVAAPMARIYVRDGQLASHIFTVMVTDIVGDGMQPKLYLTGSHWVQQPTELEKTAITPFIVAPRQTRTITVDGQQISVEGTVLMFDLKKYSLNFYESAVRLLPHLEWTVPASGVSQPPVKHIAVAEREIYLGNMSGAALWTASTMLLVTLALLVWSRSKSRQVASFKPRPSLLLLTGPDGYLSLWRTQLMLWTYAVSSLVFLFGLVRLKVPEIPDSLVVLMGLSLLTGLAAKGSPSSAPAGVQPPTDAGANALDPKPPVAQPNPPAQPAAPAQTQPALRAEAPQPKRVRAQWGDLVSTLNSTTGQVELSVPKAQMVLWTAVIVTLFCVKSVLDGTLWEVPWQMVALTGFSQAGYVGDKLVKGNS